MINSILNWLVKKSNYKTSKEELEVGFIVGFIVGLAGGLASLIGINLISFFKDFPTNYILLLVILLVLTEIVFWLDRSKPKKKEDKFKFTVKRKLISLIASIFIITQVLGSISTYKELEPQIKTYFPDILKWIGYIGVGLIRLTIIVLIFIGWAQLNKLKYER